MTRTVERFEREYFCPQCHLLYHGFSSPAEGRQPCPHCDSAPYACDQFAFAYLSDGQAKLNTVEGRDLFAETYWWREEWSPTNCHEFYRAQSYGSNHNPNPEALRFWHTRERRSLAARVGWMKRRKAVA